jgi:hypothetical protein
MGKVGFTQKLLTVCIAMTLSFEGIAQVSPAYTIIDLNTGETIDVYYDTGNWRTVNKATSQPVDFYVISYTNAATYDTVHGVTGLIVNNLMRKNEEGKWTFDEAKVKWDGNELKMKDKYGRKVKWDEGKLKIKDWNSKYKSEKGDDTKMKQEWDKIKWKDDEIKIEEGTQKTKLKQ